MLPSILARELQESVRKFLRATFPMTTPLFRRADGGIDLY
jgi:DEAD/DEAH box helicase domain-containing protein